MADTKIKISHILDSQIPDFIHEENPLFKDKQGVEGNVDILFNENSTEGYNRRAVNFLSEILNPDGEDSFFPVLIAVEK